MLLTSFDEAVYLFASGQPHLVFWTAITQLGDNITLLAVILIAGLIWRKDTKAQLMLLGAGMLSAILVLIIKYVIGRDRPDGASLLSYSFPSGHTAGATAVYGMIALLLWARGRRRWAAAVLIVPLMVGISRTMLLEHWATDVAAGWVLGAIIVAGVHFLAMHIEAVRAAGTSPPRQ